MKAVYLKQPGNVRIKEIEQRPLKDGEALLRIHSTGICGSDIGAYRGVNNLVSYPRILGHELAGEILSIPRDNPKGLKAGEKVIVDPYIYCGSCYPCSLGRTNCCTNLKTLGVHIDGGMSETFAHPANMLVKVPADMAWDIVPLAEPLCISLHGLHRLGLKPKEFIAISGAGPIGILAALAAIHYGAVPILIDPLETRLEFARTMGIKNTVNPSAANLPEYIREITFGRMAECVMEASGANSAIRSVLDIVSHAGRIVLTGWPHTETSIPTDVITKKEIDLRGARTSVGNFEEAVELIHSGKVNVSPLLTQVIPIEEAPAVIRDIDKNPGNYMKVTVSF
jgi:2-desacetyl-2-hydroxyethyl bacteriochlorophyllide A dehydrogenase